MTEKRTRLWILGTCAASGFAIGTGIMGIIDTIKDRRLERKIDRMRDANSINFAEIKYGHKQLMEQFEVWNKANQELLDEAMKRTET